MTKPYTEQLAAWVKQRNSKRRDINLAAFLAIREDVNAALEAGYPAKTIWENMSELGRVDFSYDTFLNHINRLKKQSIALKDGEVKRADEQESNKDKGNSKQKVTPEVSLKKSVPSAASLPSFTYNPIPNIEELI